MYTDMYFAESALLILRTLHADITDAFYADSVCHLNLLHYVDAHKRPMKLIKHAHNVKEIILFQC